MLLTSPRIRPLSLALVALCPLAAADIASSRDVQLINREWAFTMSDVAGAESPTFDDASWSHIGLPHSFSMPYFQADHFYVGYGWYRKVLPLTASQITGKRISIEFEGVFQDAEVFVNGKAVGHHLGGYNGFAYDVTSAVKAGSNVIAVRVNNLWNPRLTPRAGEHVFSGGIYRDVRLVITDPVHVAWYGTFVTTPKLSESSGTVNAKTELVNDDAQDKTVTLRTDIIDAKGKVVTTVSSKASIPAGKTVTVDQITPSISRPALWHPATPNLYTAVSTVLDGTRELDHYETSFGFRWIQFTPDKGFFLNGKHYYFRGANVHQDRAGWGDAVANAGFVRDVQLVKDAGMDFIRGSHYPHDPAFTTACDQLGVMYWSENCFWGTGGHKGDGYWNSSAYPVKTEDEAGFEKSVLDSLRDMIRIHRNHPSIIVWSTSNEPFFTDKSTEPKMRALLTKEVTLARELDPTRPVAIGGCQRGGIDKLGDIAGYNGDGASRKEYQNPGVASVVSEYGSVRASRSSTDKNNSYDPHWDELAKGYSPEQIKNYAWRQPWRSGESLWCGIDHGSIGGRALACMGMIDYFRLPKRTWYWYRNEYAKVAPPKWPEAGTPAGLKLTSSGKGVIEHADGTDDVQISVTVVDAKGAWINNEMPITFTVESGPGEFPTGRSITFAPKSDITMTDGMAAIDMRAYYAGTTVVKASSPGLPDARISIVSRGGPAFVSGTSPLCTERPYQRFTANVDSSKLEQQHGLSNPTSASSEAASHGSQFANDGDATTFWSAADTKTGAWWLVDLERNVAVRQVTLTFPSAGAWRVCVEVSEDKTTWKPFFDQTTEVTEAMRVINGTKQNARFVRVTFTGLPADKAASLAEFSAFGALVSE
jgi:hypothetical protein